MSAPPSSTASARKAKARRPPANMVVERCYAFGGCISNNAIKGALTSFTIDTCVKTGGASFTVAITGPIDFAWAEKGASKGQAEHTPWPEYDIWDREDGTYTVVWMPPMAGNFLFSITTSGLPIFDSPHTVNVAAAKRSARDAVDTDGTPTMKGHREMREFNRDELFPFDARETARPKQVRAPREDTSDISKGKPPNKPLTERFVGSVLPGSPKYHMFKLETQYAPVVITVTPSGPYACVPSLFVSTTSEKPGAKNYRWACLPHGVDLPAPDGIAWDRVARVHQQPIVLEGPEVQILRSPPSAGDGPGRDRKGVKLYFGVHADSYGEVSDGSAIDQEVEYEITVVTGEWDGPFPKNNRGKFVYEGTTMFGFWEEGFGGGMISYPDEGVYDGSWYHTSKHGAGGYRFVEKEDLKRLEADPSIKRNGKHSTYSGQFVDDNFEGDGVMDYPNGANYNGHWKAGLPHGLGTLSNDELLEKTSFKTYEGYFENGLRHGQGTMAGLNDGQDEYEGQWLKDVRHGDGVMLFYSRSKDTHVCSYGKRLKNGKLLPGQWAHDRFEGEGEMFYADGSTYSGQWANGVRAGAGTGIAEPSITTDNNWNTTISEKYVGDWKDDRHHGQGVRTRTIAGSMANVSRMSHQVDEHIEEHTTSGGWKAGVPYGEGGYTHMIGETLQSSYKGQHVGDADDPQDPKIKIGRREGYGVQFSAEGNATYDGCWHHGKRHGEGRIVWTDNSDLKGGNGEYSYDGQWVRGFKEGKGKSCQPCGNILEGQFVKDRANGRGVMAFANGDVYDGEYFNDERHGRGILKFKEGGEYNGFFLADFRSGKGRVTTAAAPDLWQAGMWYRDKLRPNAIEGLTAEAAEDVIMSQGSSRFTKSS